MAQDEEQDDGLNWQAEAENLSEGGDGVEYWSPDTGQTEIKFLNDGTQYRDEKKYDDEEHDYVTFRIEVDGTEYKWDMKKGSTPGSKFGQIARYAAAKDGLEGESVTWFRQGEGQQTNHVLMDLEDVEEGSDDSGSVADEFAEKEMEASSDDADDGETGEKETLFDEEKDE